MWEVGIGGLLAALEEAGFILAVGARWLVEEKERKMREKMERMSSTMVAFVRGVAEANVLLKKGLWLGGRWHSVKTYEAVQPIRVKKGWMWVSEQLDRVTGSEGTALRKVNGSVDGIFKAVGVFVTGRSGVGFLRMAPPSLRLGVKIFPLLPAPSSMGPCTGPGAGQVVCFPRQDARQAPVL